MNLNSGMILGGRYEIHEKIGIGGMAVVYRGRDIKLERSVTVKVLKEEFSQDEEFRTRFNTEARSAAKLSHPNIVNVYDVGEDNGIYYIVMEYIHGDTLKQVIKENAPLDEIVTLSIAIQMVSALATAHKNGVVHRDIKPQNILISVDGTIKITDFGIARAADVSTVTMTTNAVGSVYYFSPEQARGGYVDEKSDIYSVGITMFEMLTGHVPFDGSNSVAIALKHLKSELPDIRQYNPNVSDTIISIVNKASAKRKDDRYASSDDMLSDLKQALAEKTAIKNNIDEVEHDFEEAAEKSAAVSEMVKTNDMANAFENKLNERQAESLQNEKLNGNQQNVKQEPENEIKLEINGPRKRNIAREASEKFNEYNNKIKISKDDEYEANDYEDDFDGDIGYSVKSGIQRKQRQPVQRQEVQKQPKQQSRQRIKNTTASKNYDDDYYDNEEDDEYYRQKEKKTIIAAVITALIIIGIISFFGARFLAGQGIIPSGSSSSETGSQSADGDIAVPNFINDTVDEATEKAEALGLKINVSEEDYSDADEGLIIAQSPEADTYVSEGDIIDVAVSLGQKTFIMPNVMNKPVDEAIDTITSEGGQKPEVSYEFDDTVQEGLVMAQDPEFGTEMDSSQKITLTVSKGQENTTVVVPNFVGKDIETAQGELSAAGLEFGSSSSQDSDKPEGEIISHTPSSGESVERGTQISFVVSSGVQSEPEPETETPAQGSEGTTDTSTSDTENEGTLTFTIEAPESYNDENSISIKILKIINGNSVEVAYNDNRPLSDFPFTVEITGSGPAEVQLYLDNVYQWSQNVDFSGGN